jgi:hypothetical protein
MWIHAVTAALVTAKLAGYTSLPWVVILTPSLVFVVIVLGACYAVLTGKVTMQELEAMVEKD